MTYCGAGIAWSACPGECDVQFYGVLERHCAGVEQSSGIHNQLLGDFFGGVAPTSLMTNGACSVRLLLPCIIPHL